MTRSARAIAVVAVAGLLLAAGGGPAAVAVAAQQPLSPEDAALRALLQRVERAVQAASAERYVELLGSQADRAAAERFAVAEFRAGAGRVVVQERDRQRLAGTLPGNGYSLTVDVFIELGARARVATWQLDVKLANDSWRIEHQESVSAVENLHRLAVNPKKQFTARNFVVRAEDLELTLADGSVFVVEIDDTITALVLLGRGDMRFSPRPQSEREQVRIFSGAEVLETRFDAAYVRLGSMAGHADLSTLTARAVDTRELRRAEQVFREESAKAFVVDLSDLSRDTWSLTPSADDFLAEVRTRRFETLTYARSASDNEDVTLFDRARQRNISVYPSEQKLGTRGRFYSEDDSSPIDVLDYEIDVALSPERQWIEGRATMTLRVRARSASQLTLRLANSLTVRSVVAERFGRLFHLRVANQNSVLVNLPALLVEDTEVSLTILYSGSLEPQAPERETVAVQQDVPLPGGVLDPFPSFDTPFQPKPEASYLYSNMSYWYPQPQVSDYAGGTLQITIPPEFVCVASGAELEDSPKTVTADNGQVQKVHAFVIDRPVRYLSFLVTRLIPVATADVAFDRQASMFLPDAKELDDSLDAVKMRVAAHSRNVGRAREWADHAGEILKFYRAIVGDAPYPNFSLAVIENSLPGGHSPGYFAILNQPIAGLRVTWQNDPAAFASYPEFYLAHEIAHQWWGQAVGWRNYHEQWLSEGFAQYFAALYARQARGEETFDNVIRQMRRWAMDESDEGPVYLGYRVGHIKSDGRAFRAIVYNKGAIVLHMLRGLIGDEAFFTGLRQFYADWRFDKAGTEDFRQAMEAASKQSLERFFERWVYNSTLPQRVTLTSRVEPAAGGAGQDLVIRLEQTGEIFDMPVTVTLQYADRRPVNTTLQLTDRVVERRVPLEGPLRSLDVDVRHGTLAEFVKN
jgi:hypothetical protein